MAVPYLGYAQTAAELDPITQGLKSAGATQAIVGQNIRNQALMQESERERLKQEALRGYGQTGDMSALMKADPEMGLKMSAAQMGIASKAADYWDITKGTLTRETYGKWREDTLRQFPQINGSMFPPPEQFKDDKAFENWKYEKERVARDLKNQLTPYQAGKLQEGALRTDILGRKAEYYGQNIQDQMRHRGVLEVLRGAEIDIKNKGEQRRAGSRPSFAEFQKDPEIAQLPYSEQVYRYNYSIAAGKEAAKPIKEGKDGRMSVMPGGGHQPAESKFQGPGYYFDAKNNEVPIRTAEEYAKLIGK